MQRTLMALVLGIACATAHGAQAASGSLPADAAALRQLQEACKPESGPQAALAHVEVSRVAAAPGDLPYYEARSRLSGSSVRLYHDPDLADAAASKAACFMGTLDLLPAVLADTRKLAWSPMVITRTANYIPPKRDGELRWVNVFGSDGWDAKAMAFLLDVMPHEEVHFRQGEGIKLPRWFAEGHAEWASLQVTEQVRPDLARRARAGHAEEAAKLGKPRLGAWGGLKVKPEAIERQLSAEDRARRAKDPTYTPPGPFSFGPGDFAADDGDESGRYGAALALFTGLEQRHGRPAVQSWVRAVLDGGDAARILPLAQRMLGEDIAPLLK